MTARLILNADDFGLTAGINRAIGELHAAGVLTSATLMATGPAFDDAVAVAHAHPTLGVGCHIVLTDGTPVSPPESIPSLLGPDGKSFRPSLFDFLQALFRGRIRQDEVAREALAQVEKLQRAGIVSPTSTPTSTPISSPQSPVRYSKSPNAPRSAPSAIHLSRTGASPSTKAAPCAVSASTARRAAAPLCRASPGTQGRVLTTDGTVAISATGQLNSASLAQVLDALPPHGTYELCCHPGYNDRDLDRVTTRLRAHRDIERDALLSEVPKTLRRPNPPALIHYGGLG